MEIETPDNPTTTQPATTQVLADANQIVEQIFARLPQVIPQQQVAAPPPPQPVESQYEKARQRFIDNQTLDATNAQVIDTLLEAKMQDKAAADRAQRAKELAEANQLTQQQQIQARSNAAMTEVDKMIARFGADHPLVGKSKESIKANVAAAYNADKTLMDKFNRGEVDYAALERLTIKEVNEYIPEAQRGKSAGGPAIKTSAPPNTQASKTVNEDNLDEKGREFVAGQVNFWKKQPGYEDPAKAKEKALAVYAQAEEKRKSKK